MDIHPVLNFSSTNNSAIRFQKTKGDIVLLADI